MLSQRKPARSPSGSSGDWKLLLRPLAVTALLLAAATLLLVTLVLRLSVAPDPPTVAVLVGRSPEPSSSASPAQVEAVHQALHSLGDQCRLGKSDRSDASINRNVDTLLTFARRYPEGRFAIDDETGSALSLLFVARDTLRPCDSVEAARVDLALPSKFRDSGANR